MPLLWYIGTVGGRHGGATPEPFGLGSTFIGVVSEGACADGWSGVATLGGGLIRDNLGCGATSRRGCGPTGDTTSNFAGAGVGFGTRR